MTATAGQSHLPLEARVLISAVAPGGSTDELSRLVEDAPDWERAIELAANEKLLPPFWQSISDLPIATEQPGFAALRRLAAVTDFELHSNQEGLAKTLRVLAEADIPVMLLKGAALVHTVYGEYRQRPMGDLDLLLPPDRIDEAWERLREAGWQPEYGSAEEFWDDLHHLRPLVNPGTLRVAIELHRTIVRPGPFSVDHERMWAESRPLEVGGVEVRVPSPHHLLLHLCIHHAWPNMLTHGLVRTARDISAVVYRDPPEWEALVELARSSRAETCVYWSLRLARTLGVERIPDATFEALRPSRPSFLLDALERAYLTASVGEGYPSVRFGQLCWSAGILPGASAHGDRRPWHDGARWRTLMVGNASESLLARLLYHLRRPREWAQFLRAILLRPGIR